MDYGLFWVRCNSPRDDHYSDCYYSTKDSSIGYFNNPIAEWIIICGMIVGSLPFLYYLRVVRGNLSPIIHDSQVRWFLIVIIFSVVLVTFWVWNTSNSDSDDTVRHVAFNVISILTGTGYVTQDFGSWGGLSYCVFTLPDVYWGVCWLHYLALKFSIPSAGRVCEGPIKSIISAARRLHPILQ